MRGLGSRQGKGKVGTEAATAGMWLAADAWIQYHAPAAGSGGAIKCTPGRTEHCVGTALNARRYLVVLRYGGVYAEPGVECATPLDAVLHPGDTLVTGWEAEAATDAAALARGMVRRRQLLQWWFAAAPGHPALQEVVNRVVGSVGQRLSEDPHRDALERTGPGVWTDVVLRYALWPASSAQVRGAGFEER